MNIWNAEFKMGTIAIKNRTQRNVFSQCLPRFCKNPITPVILNNGSQAPREAHCAAESGVKFGLAGMSGGKKKHSKIWTYRWFQP